MSWNRVRSAHATNWLAATLPVVVLVAIVGGVQPLLVLRAKMLAAIWRAREAGMMLIALWTVGLLAGAVHPLGFLNAVAGLIVIGSLYASAGASLSLGIGERK